MISPNISVVIPLKDEERNVEPLVAELTRVMVQLAEPYELILIDDGSTDATFTALTHVQVRDARVRVVRFTRNFGQTAAFAAGFHYAKGALIVTCDGDLQNDPADIPRLLALTREYDVIVGWRRRRRDAFLTRHLPSVVANYLIGIVTGIRLHDNGCSLKVFRAGVVKPLKLRPGLHRYLPALASQLGARVTEIQVTHRPRVHGHSKYGLSRTFGVIVDLLRLRRLMREAADPSTPASQIYEVAEVLESVG